MSSTATSGLPRSRWSGEDEGVILGVEVDIALSPGTCWFILSTDQAKWSLHLVFSASAYLRGQSPVGPRYPWELTAQDEREADRSATGMG